MTEFGNCVNVTFKGGSPTCRCRNSQSTAGLCSHILAVMDTMGTLPTFLDGFNKKKGKSPSILGALIIEEVRRPDREIDFQKPLAFTEIWHNNSCFVKLK